MRRAYVLILGLCTLSLVTLTAQAPGPNWVTLFDGTT